MAKIDISKMYKQMGIVEATPRMLSDAEQEILSLEKVLKITERHLKEVRLDPFYEDVLFKGDKKAHEEHVRKLEKGVLELQKYISDLKKKMEGSNENN